MGIADSKVIAGVLQAAEGFAGQARRDVEQTGEGLGVARQRVVDKVDGVISRLQTGRLRHRHCPLCAAGLREGCADMGRRRSRIEDEWGVGERRVRE